MTFQESLNWRYATKRMNGTGIDAKKLHRILEAIRLAPSSMGLQPFSVVVVQDLKKRQAMAPACFNQPQITESGAVLVFSVWQQITEKEVTIYIENMAATRKVSVESLHDFKNRLLGFMGGKTQEELQVWAAKQAYIALGFGLAACSVEEIDSTPMEGFNPAQLDKVLELDQKGLHSMVMLSVGYRDADKDHLTNAAKVRRAHHDFFVNI